MASLNAPKKAKTVAASTAKITTKPVAQKKPTTTKSCGCDVNKTLSATSGQRRSHLANNQPAKKATKQNGQQTATHTKIVVQCNCGFTNNLYIRGEGVKELSWEKGTLMNCTKADEWIWETDTPFTQAQIKVLINDKEYELGENHAVDCGKQVKFAPQFPKK